jgi:hypothetical protein
VGVAVAVPATGVTVGVAVAGIGVDVRVAVAGSGVDVGVAVTVTDGVAVGRGLKAIGKYTLWTWLGPARAPTTG